jgi:enamine deaminase RidA (YjgF/YER057c/UK114 family)
MPIAPQFLSDVPGVEGVPTLVVASGSRTLYFTGQVALDSTGHLVGDTLEEQAIQVFRNLAVAFDAVGVKGPDIASMTIHVVTDDFDDALGQLLSAAIKLQAEDDGTFGELLAASTMVAVAGLYLGALIEISVVAVLE